MREPLHKDHRFSIRVLCGLFEADASGAVAIIATLAMVLVGRWLGLI